MEILRFIKRKLVLFSVLIFLVSLLVSSIGLKLFLAMFMPDITLLRVLLLTSSISILVTGILFPVCNHVRVCSIFADQKYDEPQKC